MSYNTKVSQASVTVEQKLISEISKVTSDWVGISIDNVSWAKKSNRKVCGLRLFELDENDVPHKSLEKEHKKTLKDKYNHILSIHCSHKDQERDKPDFHRSQKIWK